MKEFRCNYGNDFAQKNSTGKRAQKKKTCARDEPAWRRTDSSEKQGASGRIARKRWRAGEYHRFDIVTRSPSSNGAVR